MSCVDCGTSGAHSGDGLLCRECSVLAEQIFPGGAAARVASLQAGADVDVVSGRFAAGSVVSLVTDSRPVAVHTGLARPATAVTQAGAAACASALVDDRPHREGRM